MNTKTKQKRNFQRTVSSWIFRFLLEKVWKNVWNSLQSYEDWNSSKRAVATSSFRQSSAIHSAFNIRCPGNSCFAASVMVPRFEELSSRSCLESVHTLLYRGAKHPVWWRPQSLSSSLHFPPSSVPSANLLPPFPARTSLHLSPPFPSSNPW